MVVTALIFAVTISAPAATDDGSGTEPNMRKTHLPPISKVTIQNGDAVFADAGEQAAQCANFKLSLREVREYLGRAAEIAEHDYFHMIDWSPCYVRGEVAFRNGITGIWAIQQYRGGLLRLSNGRTLYLFCPRCHAKGFPSADE